LFWDLSTIRRLNVPQKNGVKYNVSKLSAKTPNKISKQINKLIHCRAQ